jgi:hypothetical protein
MGELIFIIDKKETKCTCGKVLTSENAFIVLGAPGTPSRYVCIYDGKCPMTYLGTGLSIGPEQA